VEETMAKKKKPKAKHTLLIVTESPFIKTGLGHVRRTFAHLASRCGQFDNIILVGYSHPKQISEETEVDLPKGIKVILEESSNTMCGLTLVPALLFEHTSGRNRIYVITVGDPWNFMYMEAFAGHNNVVWMPYVAVESNFPSSPVTAKPIPDASVSLPVLYRKADVPIAYSEEGMRVINESGVQCDDYLYHLVDSRKVITCGRTQESMSSIKMIRQVMGPNTKLIGIVCANSYRKGLDLIMQTLKILIEEYNDDVVALFHTPRGEGKDKTMYIEHLATEYGVPIIIAEDIITKQCFDSGPVTILGYTDEQLDGIYRSLDVYISMARAEGFGIPVVEAAMRGVYTIVPDCGTTGEIGRKIVLDLIESESGMASANNTNQTYFQPKPESAAKLIHKRITKPEKKQYQLYDFELNHEGVMDKFKEIVLKGKNLRKANKNIQLLFASTHMVDTTPGTYTVNSCKCGVNAGSSLTSLIDFYKGYNIDMSIGLVSADARINQIYSNMFKQALDFVSDSVRNICVASWVFPITETESLKTTDVMPDTLELVLRKRTYYTKHQVQETEDPGVLIVVVDHVKSGMIAALIDSNKTIFEKYNVYFTVVESISSVTVLSNVACQHLIAAGARFIDIEDIQEGQFEYSILPYMITNDLPGQFILNKVKSFTKERVIVNSLIPGYIQEESIVNMCNDHTVANLYGEWHVLDQIIKVPVK
jgi:glycosyltransferase involved in cell wall biosynthesis